MDPSYEGRESFDSVFYLLPTKITVTYSTLRWAYRCAHLSSYTISNVEQFTRLLLRTVTRFLAETKVKTKVQTFGGSFLSCARYVTEC